MILPNTKWEVIEDEVVRRIRLLKGICEQMEDNELSRKMAKDLFIPCLRLLAQFVGSVEIAEDKP